LKLPGLTRWHGACFVKNMSQHYKNNHLKNNHSSGWVTLPINLRISQYEALSRFADEMGMTTSRTTRRILSEFLSVVENENGADRVPERSGVHAESCSVD
jgi:hypothetical protein